LLAHQSRVEYHRRIARSPSTTHRAPRRRARDEHAEVGAQLRAERESRGLSLRELARRVELSASALSQIETGRSRPSVSTLYAIVSELGMSLDELFGGTSRETTAATSPPAQDGDSQDGRGRTADSAEEAGPVQRAATRQALELESGVRWERLTATPNPDVDFLYLTYEVGGTSSTDGLIRHSGIEYGLILSGRLTVTVGFDSYELEAGDAISFPSTTPHRLSNEGDAPVEAVWFVIGRGSADVRRAGAR
jgi:transcriptional regulator with XRE-family HTH domain